MEDKKKELFEMMPQGSFNSFQEFSTFVDNEGYESVYGFVENEGYFKDQDEYVNYFSPQKKKTQAIPDTIAQPSDSSDLPLPSVSPSQKATEAKLVWEEISPQVDNWGPKEFKTFSKTKEAGELPKPEVNLFIPSKAVPTISAYSPLAAETSKAYNRGLASGLTATNIRSNKPDLKRIAELQKIVKSNQPSGAYKDYSESENISDALKVFAKNPVEVLTALTAESLSAQAGAVGSLSPEATAIGAGVGSSVPVLGTAAGGLSGAAGSVSLALEASSFFTEKLQQDGYDITDPNDLEKAFNNKVYVQELINEGTERGLPVAAFDALSMGVAGKLGGGTVVKKLIRETPVQAALGSAGEASKQIISDGGITDPVAILSEGLGEIGGGAPEIFTGIATNNPELLKRPSVKRQDKISKLEEAEAQIEKDIETSPEWAKEPLIEKRNQILDEKNKEVVAQAEEYSKFSDEDKSRVGEINERLDDIESLSEQDLSDATKETLVNEAKGLISEKEQIENKYQDQPVQQTEEFSETEQEVESEQDTQQPVNQEDAIQERETTEVPSESEAQPIQEVEGEVRGERESQEGTQEGRGQDEIQEEVVLKYEPKTTPKQFSNVDGGVRVFKEAANAYNKALDRRQGEQVAIDDAVSYIQGTKAYENANDVQRESMIRSFREEVGERNKRGPSAKKIIGQPSDKSVTVNERSALKEQLRLEAKAAREGYRQSTGEVKDFQKRIKSVLNNKDFLKKGLLTPAQSKSLARAASGVRTPSEMRRFMETSNRIINDVEYADKLIEATSFKTKLSKKGKNLPSNISSTINDFLKLKPNSVQDINKYNRVAGALLAYKKNPKISVSEKGVSVEATDVIPLSEVQNFIDSERKTSEKKLIDDALEDNQELVDEGVLDDKMSYDDIKRVLDAIEGEPDINVFGTDPSGQRKREGFKRIVNYLQQDLLNSEIEPEGNLAKEAKKGLQEVSVDGLTDAQLGSLYVSLHNAINNNAYNGAYKFESISKAQKNSPKMATLYRENARKISDISAKVANIQALSRAMTGTSKDAAEVRVLSGMSSIFNGNARAQKEKERVADRLKRMITTKEGKFNTIEENSFLTMYSTLLTVGPENFNDYKKAIRDAIDNDLISKDDNVRKSAIEIKKVFDSRIANANNIKQIKATAKEKQILNFLEKEFKNKKEQFKELSEIVYNIKFDEIGDVYFPILIKNRKTEDIPQEITASSFYRNQRVLPNKDGSLNSRTYSIDPTKQTFDFDFLNAVITKYGSQVKDIETAKGISDFNSIVTGPNSDAAFNGNQNVIRKRMQKYVNNDREYDSATPIQKLIIDVLNLSAKVGTRLKLGGASQIVVQTVPVWLRSMSVMGTDFNLINKGVFKGLMTERESANKLFEKYPISLRGYLRQEFKSTDKTIPKATREKWRSKLNSAYIKSGEVIDKMMMSAIELGDVKMAEATWLGFYLKSLKDQGIYDGSQSMEDLANNPNDLAAEYAEQMVAETQVPSDTDQNGYLFSNSDNIAQAARRVAFPFITFRANQAYSLMNSYYSLKGNDKKTALKEIAGVFAENITFTSLTTGRYLLTIMGANAIASVMGIDLDNDDEDDKKRKFGDYVAQVLARSFSEMNPFYGYGLLDKAQNEKLNKFYFNYIMSNDERDEYLDNRALKRAKTDLDKKLIYDRAFNNFAKTSKVPLRDYGNKEGFESLGQIGFPISTGKEVLETYNMSNDDVYSYINKWNSQRNIELTDAERDLLLLSAMMQASNYFIPKEVADVGRRLKSGVIYKNRGSKKKFPKSTR